MTRSNVISNLSRSLLGVPRLRKKIRIECLFLEFLGFQHSYYSKSFLQELSEDDRNYVLQYLSSGKGFFPYESVTGFNSLSATPHDGDFWTIDKFYSRLRDEGISQKEWEGCRKLYKILRMRNLSDFNDVYKIQNVYILGVILEYRWQKVKEATGFDPRCFTSASTLSGAIEKIKSKVILILPTNVETVRLMESLLSGGYSSVHTRLGFDTEIFTPRTPEYVEQKEDIINNLRDLYGEKNEKQERKKLMDKLIPSGKRKISKIVTSQYITLDWTGRKVVKREEFLVKSLNSMKTINTVLL